VEKIPPEFIKNPGGKLPLQPGRKGEVVGGFIMPFFERV